MTTIKRVTEGLAEIQASIRSGENAADAMDRARRLTSGRWILPPRQREVAALIASARRNKDIAHELGLSLGTVKVYTSKIYDRLELLRVRTESGQPVRNRVALATWWSGAEDEPSV